MNKLFYMKFLLLLIVLVTASCQPKIKMAEAPNRAEQIVAEINDPFSKYVLVISHRGDWRNYPENSIPAIESIIKMGVDIMELDVQLTKDSVLVLCHDKTIDRTTLGKGLVSEITYDSIQNSKLRTAHGVATKLNMPTLKEALEVCKDRIVVNIDKGYDYYDLILEITEELGLTNQVLIKGKQSINVVLDKFSMYYNNMMYMPIIDIQKTKGQQLFASYINSGVQPLAYEICWNNETPEVLDAMKKAVESGSKLWVNSLWESICGGLCDDVAWESGDMEGVYGKLLNMGATMIQTDRPDQLLNYLRSKGRHE